METASILLPSLRAYIVRHARQPRCEETARPGQQPTAVSDFNYMAAALDPAGNTYKPISAEESTPERSLGSYERYPWWTSPRGKQVIGALQWLNHGNRDLPGNDRFFTLAERMSEEWNAHFLDALRLIEGWKESEESSSEDWFGMASDAYGLLAELAPPGRQREAAAARYLNFMETHYTSIAHNLWFTQLHSRWKSEDAWMVEQFAASPNPVMSLYARATKLMADADSK